MLNYKKNLIIYFLLCLFISIVFLHKNYINLHGLGFVEWLNNYQHSLVRRALVGEINYRFSTFFNINLLKVTFATQIFFVFVFYYFSTKFFLNFNQKSFLKILAIFSPIGFLFPVGEVEALGRQEIIFLAFVAFYFYSLLKIKNILLVQLFLIFSPIILFSHEGMIFFFPYLILANVFFLYKNNFKKYLLINVVISIYILILFVILNLSINTDISAVKGICKSLENYIKPFSHCIEINGINKISETKMYSVNQFLERFEFFKVFKYFIFILIGYLPLLFLIKEKKKIEIFNINLGPFASLILCIMCSLPLYLAIDWGRWTYINYTCSLFFIFFLYIFNFIEFKKEKIYNFLENLNTKFKILIFIIFCLGWNLKILFTDDIGSLPLYRSLRKSILYLLNYI
tara:strand:- start:238 stop:1437 length:1200 start_codon:yes stop_codon:yes gene_type:complete